MTPSDLSIIAISLIVKLDDSAITLFPKKNEYKYNIPKANNINLADIFLFLIILYIPLLFILLR